MNNELAFIHMRLNKQNKKETETITELENEIDLIISKELFYQNSCDIGDVTYIFMKTCVIAFTCVVQCV